MRLNKTDRLKSLPIVSSTPCQAQEQLPFPLHLRPVTPEGGVLGKPAVKGHLGHCSSSNGVLLEKEGLGLQIPKVTALIDVGEDSTGLSGSSKLNFLVPYAKDYQGVELGLWKVSSPISHHACGQKGSALEKRTSGACLPLDSTQLQCGEGRFWLGQVAR